VTLGSDQLQSGAAQMGTLMRFGLFILLCVAASAQDTGHGVAGLNKLATPAHGLPTAKVMFYKDVLPILQQHCQVCHRPGEAAPMPLLDYEGTRPWAKSIKQAILLRKMPPWFADPAYGHFANDRRLADADIRTLVSWVDAGAPEGDRTDAPPPVHWTQGWNIRPDVVLEMPNALAVPASGVLQYAYIVIPTGFVKDTWVTAAEIRPGAPAVVHHVNAIVRPPGASWLRDVKPGTFYIPDPANHDGYPDSTDPEGRIMDAADEFLAGYAPGMQAQHFDMDHSAKLIPAGSDIVLQIHHTTDGKAVRDRVRVALTIANTPPAKRFYSATAVSWKWVIPPGDPNYEGHARLTFGEPVELVFLQPHMHLRGKDMTVKLTLPNGESQTVLSVPNFNFSWQVIYYLAQPLPLPKGTRVEVTAHWDNSANNPYNPDPNKAVRWGTQSWDEMLNLNMGVITDLD
jgi:hypothetical protein